MLFIFVEMLEASGIFTPKAIAHFKQQSTFPEDVEADIVINGNDGLGGKKIENLDIHIHCTCTCIKRGGGNTVG